MLCKGYFLNKYDILSEIIVAYSQEYFHGRRGVEPFNKEGVSHVLEYFSLWKLSSWLGSERGTELWFRGVTPLPSQPVPMTFIWSILNYMARLLKYCYVIGKVNRIDYDLNQNILQTHF